MWPSSVMPFVCCNSELVKSGQVTMIYSLWSRVKNRFCLEFFLKNSSAFSGMYMCLGTHRCIYSVTFKALIPLIASIMRTRAKCCHGHSASSAGRVSLPSLSSAGCAIQTKHAEEVVEWLNMPSLSIFSVTQIQTSLHSTAVAKTSYYKSYSHP